MLAVSYLVRGVAELEDALDLELVWDAPSEGQHPIASSSLVARTKMLFLLLKPAACNDGL